MKLSEDSLYRLVHSLSAAEKSQFKKHAKMQNAADAAYLILFDLLAKQKRYDLESIRNKMGHTVSNVIETKRYLYSALIDFLIKARPDEHSYTDVLNLLQREVRVLYKKGLFKEAYTVLKAAKEMAYKYECFNQLLELIDIERPFIRIIFKDGYYKQMEEIDHEKSNVIQNISSCDRSKMYYQKICYYQEKCSREGDLQYIDELHQPIQADILTTVETPNLPFLAKLNYRRSFVEYYFIIGNIEKEFEQHIKILELWNMFPYMKKKYSRLYYVWLVTYLDYCFIFKNFKGIGTLLKDIGHSNSLNAPKKESLVFKHNYLYLKCRLHEYTGNFTESLKCAILSTELSALEKNTSYMLVIERVLSYLGVSVIYFISAKYREASLYLDKIDEHYSVFSKTRMDIVAKLKIMKLLIQFAEGNLSLLQIQYEANKVFFHRGREKKTNQVGAIFMEFFKKIIHDGTSEKKIHEGLREFKNELIQKKLHHELEFYINFDFVSWIDSYITKVPMEDIMREKAHKEYPEVLTIDF